MAFNKQCSVRQILEAAAAMTALSEPRDCRHTLAAVWNFSFHLLFYLFFYLFSFFFHTIYAILYNYGILIKFVLIVLDFSQLPSKRNGVIIKTFHVEFFCWIQDIFSIFQAEATDNGNFCYLEFILTLNVLSSWTPNREVLVLHS